MSRRYRYQPYKQSHFDIGNDDDTRYWSKIEDCISGYVNGYSSSGFINDQLRKHDYMVVPSQGVVEAFQDDLGFIHLKVGVCRENWRSGRLAYFVDRDFFKKMGDL